MTPRVVLIKEKNTYFVILCHDDVKQTESHYIIVYVIK